MRVFSGFFLFYAVVLYGIHFCAIFSLILREIDLLCLLYSCVLIYLSVFEILEKFTSIRIGSILWYS